MVRKRVPGTGGASGDAPTSPTAPQRRATSINLRLTETEAVVLDSICAAHGGISRAAMVRQLMMFQSVPSIPPINQEAFRVLATASETLLDLRDLVESRLSSGLDAGLCGLVTERLSNIRRSLLLVS